MLNCPIKDPITKMRVAHIVGQYLITLGLGLLNNHVGWNFCVGWQFFLQNYSLFFQKLGGPKISEHAGWNKSMQGGIFPPKNKIYILQNYSVEQRYWLLTGQISGVLQT